MVNERDVFHFNGGDDLLFVRLLFLIGQHDEIIEHEHLTLLDLLLACKLLNRLGESS